MLRALREEVVRTALTEGALINALRVEPELGTPARGGLPATVAMRHGDHWRVSGHKLYTTGIPALRWLSVWGRTDEPDPRVGFFLVPRPVTPAAQPPRCPDLGLGACRQFAFPLGTAHAAGPAPNDVPEGEHTMGFVTTDDDVRMTQR